jgi:hypothetical protein
MESCCTPPSCDVASLLRESHPGGMPIMLPLMTAATASVSCSHTTPQRGYMHQHIEHGAGNKAPR